MEPHGPISRPDAEAPNSKSVLGRLRLQRRLSHLGPLLLREQVGLVVAVGAMVFGAVMLWRLFLGPLLAQDAVPWPLLWGTLLALPSALVYIGIVRYLDRYDPEPAYAEIFVFLWGATFAAGVSAAVSAGDGPLLQRVAGALPENAANIVFAAPVVEELTKGLALAMVFVFLRREFDGAVDGMVYGTFVGLGFATVENLILYARVSIEGDGSLGTTFLLRSMLSPWGHPLYASMTGLGFGIAREAEHPLARILGPATGFTIAVALHTLWNASLVASTATGVPLAAVLFPMWTFFLALFLTLVGALVKRKGLLLEEYLADEVALGVITREELAFLVQPWAPRAARGSGGVRARAFVRLASRLAMAKWHAMRASRRHGGTLSEGRVGELRGRLLALRRQLPGGTPVRGSRPPAAYEAR